MFLRALCGQGFSTLTARSVSFEKHEVRAIPQLRGQTPTRPRGQDDVVFVRARQIQIPQHVARPICVARFLRLNQSELLQKLVDVADAPASRDRVGNFRILRGKMPGQRRQNTAGNVISRHR